MSGWILLSAVIFSIASGLLIGRWGVLVIPAALMPRSAT
jgi:hypothetical protein